MLPSEVFQHHDYIKKRSSIYYCYRVSAVCLLPSVIKSIRALLAQIVHCVTGSVHQLVGQEPFNCPLLTSVLLVHTKVQSTGWAALMPRSLATQSKIIINMTCKLLPHKYIFLSQYQHYITDHPVTLGSHKGLRHNTLDKSKISNQYNISITCSSVNPPSRPPCSSSIHGWLVLLCFCSQLCMYRQMFIACSAPLAPFINNSMKNLSYHLILIFDWKFLFCLTKVRHLAYWCLFGRLRCYKHNTSKQLQWTLHNSCAQP